MKTIHQIAESAYGAYAKKVVRLGVAPRPWDDLTTAQRFAWYEATRHILGETPSRERIVAAVTGCPHTIDRERVELERDDRQGGGVALAQIADRVAALYPASPVPDVEAQEAARNESRLHPAVIPDTIVNGGALKLALNVLRRAGKGEVADELEKTAKPIRCAEADEIGTESRPETEQRQLFERAKG